MDCWLFPSSKPGNSPEVATPRGRLIHTDAAFQILVHGLLQVSANDKENLPATGYNTLQEK